MTNTELQTALLEYVKKGNCFTTEVQKTLIKYRKSGGQQDTAKQILEDIKNTNPNNETIQDGVDDILDIVTGYCSVDMRVWKD